MKNEFQVKGDETIIFLKKKDGTVLETFIDTEDLELLKELRNTWCAQWDPKGQTYYAYGWNPKTKKHIKLHRLLMKNPKGLVVDHINRSTLDNRKNNLRIVTQRENIHNQKNLSKVNKSGVKGVSWDKFHGKWRAQISVNKRVINLGRFSDIKEAQVAYLEAKEKYHQKTKEETENDN
ncbi:HNH endonuclease [Bacillus thuringiensis]|uniref:HNH endonuclease n=1 Tax=Bacillus thuringiensis TaxID=1428 RepID=UPI000BFC799F|nr:HNH endonuclease [Bacillus thuringiensis]PGU35172.1 hypothetical protein COD63_29870 [Bacillus thuringiensis]